MKKIFVLGLIALIGLLGHTAHAQFGDYGVKAGLGVATITDDLATHSPILGANVGGYINYTFAKSKSVLAEIFYLQSGINITRRGRNFQEIFQLNNSMSIREGYSHAYSVQVPILAGVHMELPIRSAGHVVGVFLGPAVSYGFWGRYTDRMVSPGNPDPRVNYDLSIEGTDKQRNIFTHVNRLDVNAILGLSYEYGNFTLSLFVDHGFMPIAKDKDILRIINNAQSTASNKVDEEIPDGNNTAYMISLAYRLGIFSKSNK